MTGVAKYRAIVVKWLKSTGLKIVKFFMNKENWKNPKVWIAAAVVLRMMYVAMNEYGLNPLKKSIAGDHVFLTGAGAGIGRLMALRLGLQGCKLSLSDINEAGVNETKAFLIQKGVPEKNIFVFKCDMSSVVSIKEGSQLAREHFGDVQILINNAGIVSGKTTLELSTAEI